MNIQRRIPFTGWMLRWIDWWQGEGNWCVGVHVYPIGAERADSLMIHLLPAAILLTKGAPPELSWREALQAEIHFWQMKTKQAGGVWRLLTTCNRCVLEHRARYWAEIRRLVELGA